MSMTEPTTRRRLHPVVRLLLIITLGAAVSATFITASIVTPDHIRDGVNSLAEAGLYFFALPAAALYIGLFVGFSDWRSTLPGRAAATAGFSVITILLVNAASLFLGPDYPGREWIRVIAYWGLGVAQLYLCYSVWHFQRLGLIQRRQARRERQLAEANTAERDAV